MAKKKKLFAGLVLALLLGNLVFGMIPRPLFENAENIDIHRVEKYNGIDGYDDITEQVKPDDLALCLTLFRCSRVPHALYGFQMEDVTYQIHGIYNGDPFHINVGNRNYIYESGDTGGYTIRNAEALPGIIESCMKD